MLEFKNISQNYGDKKVLDNVSLTISKGEFVVFLGANGAGKSTLLKIASRYIKPSSGEILLKNRQIEKYSMLELARIRAVLEQESQLSFDYTTLETVELGGYSRQADEIKTLKEDAKKALADVGLAGFENRMYTTLSGGEKRRVQLARALCQLGNNVDGKILFLDEPSAGLDPAHAHIAIGVARGLANRGATVIAVLHDPNLTASYADKVVFLKAGKLLKFVNVSDMFDESLISQTYSTKCKIIKTETEKFIHFPI